jgi:hypothetical protein
LGWTVRAASVDDGPKEELLNRGHVPVSGDIAYLHTQRAVHFIDFGAPPLLCSLFHFPPPFRRHVGIIPRRIPCVRVCALRHLGCAATDSFQTRAGKATWGKLCEFGDDQSVEARAHTHIIIYIYIMKDILELT